MSKVVCMILCVLCAEIAVAQGMRLKRAAAGATSNSYSSSSSSSSGSGGGGGSNTNFMFPAGNYPYSPFPGAPGFMDFNNLFQQFLAGLQAAQTYAATNPAYAQLFQQQIAQLIAQQQAAMFQFPFAYPKNDANFIAPENRFGGSSANENPNSVYTFSSANLGPQGGYGQAGSFPGGSDGLGTRIAEEFPAPNGPGSFGVFTSSSSGVSNSGGKTTSYKTSTFGTNDNGKITFRTVNE